jgi:hypothetical protein
MNATEMLEKLTEFYAQLDYLQFQKAELLDTVMPPEIKKAMQDIDAEFAGKEQAVRENMAALEKQVKQAVIDGGETIRGGLLQAVYNKGRTSWDNVKLEGLMIAFPKLADARKIGEPYVAIKKVG